MKTLKPNKVKEEFNFRARSRIGISKVLSTRFSSSVNDKFDADVKALLHKHFSSVHFKNVLEVGVGIGRLAPFFIERADMFFGIDFSEGMLDEASENLSQYKNVELIYGDAVELEFEEGFFDIGIVSLVLKHNSDERALQLIENMKKWCKKILLIEHVSGGAGGSDIAVIRDEQWYIKKFLPRRLKVYTSFKRFNDHIIFCIFESQLTTRTTLFLVRHGQMTVSNPSLISGQRNNPPLSPEGIKQIEALGKTAPFLSFDAVYTSCLRRAIQSARLLSQSKLLVIKDKRLNEIDFGIYSGKDIREYPEVFVSKYQSYLKDAEAFPGGESLEDVERRIESFHKDLLLRRQSTICIVSHQWALNCYLKVLLKTSKNFRFEQGAFTIVEIEDGKVLSFKHNLP